MGESLIVSLSELAARVQRGRTTDQVLQIAGEGVHRLGIRLVAFQIVEDDLVLRYVATSPPRLRAIEELVQRPLAGMRAPLADWELVRRVVRERQNIYREDLDLFDRFLREATGHDLKPLDASPDTAGITNGVLAPLFVADRPWGLLALVSTKFRAEDAAAVALFAMQVGSAIEVAEFIEELVKREQLAALGELAATVAHEVRNPLGVIFNALALLRRSLEREQYVVKLRQDAEPLLGVMHEESERLNRMVTELLDFARPTPLHLERGSLAEIAEGVLSAATQRPEAAKIEFEIDVPPDLAPLEMDVRLVHQALLNLVVNGMQAMPNGGTLRLQARTERDAERGQTFACIRVSDTGRGIPPDAHARVFEPFFTTKPSGTGLGLALVKRVIEPHGGEITLETGPHGTTFSLRLPVDVTPRAPGAN